MKTKSNIFQSTLFSKREIINEMMRLTQEGRHASFFKKWGDIIKNV